MFVCVCLCMFVDVCVRVCVYVCVCTVCVYCVYVPGQCPINHYFGPVLLEINEIGPRLTKYFSS